MPRQLEEARRKVVLGVRGDPTSAPVSGHAVGSDEASAGSSAAALAATHVKQGAAAAGAAAGAAARAHVSGMSRRLKDDLVPFFSCPHALAKSTASKTCRMVGAGEIPRGLKNQKKSVVMDSHRHF